VLGICLGHQLLGLAAGHETTKLPFGHRGANHPVLDRRTGRVLVTSQNHGFAVVASEDVTATHVSLYDGTVEGFDFPDERACSVQFHPEAGPGPHDAWPILEDWVANLEPARAR
jgi:carbamoyl-phosphate synthase small subunit